MASPAEPLLASALWRTNRVSNDSIEPTLKSTRLNTGCQTIDNALEGGLDYGSICCISGENDTGARDIVQALLISQLFSSPTARATIIDTGLSLDIRRLHRALTARLTERSDAAEHAARMLARVNVMKVFDFVGMTEAIAELKGSLAVRERSSERSATAGKSAPRGTIGDSEDEVEEEDMLATSPQQSPPISTSGIEQNTDHHLLIIDNITQITSPLLKANYARGQGILSSFMRSLSHLTRTHSICTVLVNGVTSYPNAKEESPSIFSSCTLQPALGRAFTYALDVHLLVHEIPRTAGQVEKVSVVEVLQDRYGGRSGKWAAFTTDQDGGVTGVS